MNKNRRIHDTKVDIITSNVYLNKALRSLVAEFPECERNPPSEHHNYAFLKTIENLKITLVDIEYIYTSQNAWNKIQQEIAKSDYCIFIALTDMKFGKVPFLSICGSVCEIKNNLISIINNANLKNNSLTISNLLSALSLSEKEVIFFLMSGYSLNEISQSLGKSIKTIHHSKMNVIKKMTLANKKNLHVMLKFCRFVEYYTFKENTHATGENAYAIKNKNMHFLESY